VVTAHALLRRTADGVPLQTGEGVGRHQKR
jgi:hypothetical protein